MLINEDNILLWSNLTTMEWDDPVCLNDSSCTDLSSLSAIESNNETTLIGNALDVINTTASSTLRIFNFSYEKAISILIENNKIGYLDPSTEIIFIVLYSVLIVFGIFGNGLIGYVIWRKASMRTARNLFIINLTISDLFMCMVCMPFTLVGLLVNDWTLGSVICKLIPVIQCTNILVSTATIVAIAVDRYVSIVCIGRSNRKKWHVAIAIGLIWLASFLFTFPLYSYYFVNKVTFGNIVLFHKCIERWPSRYVKESWIVLLLLSQYVFPIVTLAIVHGSINRYLNKHMISHGSNNEHRRNKRTTILLSTIAISFAVSWLPWHIVNLLADFHYHKFKIPKNLYTAFGTCHIIAMSTACSNPVLYGWLNTNLRRELSECIPNFLKVLSRSYKPTNSKRRGTGPQISTGVTSTVPGLDTISLYDLGRDERSMAGTTPPLTTSILLDDAIL